MDTDHDGQEVCEHSALEVLTKTQGQTNTCAKTNGKNITILFMMDGNFGGIMHQTLGPRDL